MPKRKKYPALPNGYGSIRYLGKNRTNPYAVHPPAVETDKNGNYIRPKALCYVDDWYVGFAVLNAFHAGTYKPGDEIIFKSYRPAGNNTDLDEFCKRLLTDFTAHAYVKTEAQKNEKTFAEVYELFFDWKYGPNAPKKLSKQSQNSTRAAYKNCSSLHQRSFRDLRHQDLQKCLDSCTLKAASLELMMSLFKQMYKYAELYELCDKDYAKYLRMPDAEEDEHGVPFTEADLVKLWKNKDNPTTEMLLIMCYSGYRISAYRTIEVNIDTWYFKGGVKTAAAKSRVVPIHTAIQPLVKKRMARDGGMLVISPLTFRREMSKTLEALKIDAHHTPHDCRHTFSMLCEKYGVPDSDRKRMLGHSFGQDVTNRVYGHRTLEDLRESIQKIEAVTSL